jgi:outer membrane autotransporter protein
VFETVLLAEAVGDVWYQSADAVTAQLDSARDGVTRGEAATIRTGAGTAGWVQIVAGDHERDAIQSIDIGGTATEFDVGYDRDYEGLQGGLEYLSRIGEFGLTFGIGQSDNVFTISSNRLDLESINFGAYAAFSSGGFFANLLAKVDWIEAETNPGAGLAAEFDARATGVRAVGGFRFDLGGFYAEPAISLSWVEIDVDEYGSGGATVATRDFDSLRGTVGIRAGGDLALAGGTLSPFVGLQAVEEFEGNARTDFTLGDTILLRQEAPGTWGEASGGATFTTGNVEAFIRGELVFGDEVRGMEGRAGVRIRF